MTWHDIANANDPELDRLAAEYHLHPLHIEDCRHGGQRGKAEEGAGYEFVVLKPVVTSPDEELTFLDLDVFLGEDWIITVREGDPKASDKLLEPIHAAAMPGGTCADRPAQILYRIFDATVDSYLPVTDRIDDAIDELEELVLADPTPDVLARIFRERRKLIELRRVLVNTRDVAAHLYRTEHTLIPSELVPFLRDVYDHLARNLDLVETQRDLLAGAMDVYLSSVANKTNQVMKVLTVLGTVALPALVISGYFGMNFKGLPLSESPDGTLIVSGLMIVTTILLLALLRFLKWF
jgi:magnesium transporter